MKNYIKALIAVILICIFSMFVVYFDKESNGVHLTRVEREWIKNNKSREIVAKCVPENGIYYTEKNGRSFGIFKDLQNYINNLYGINLVTKKDPQNADVLWALEIDNIEDKTYMPTNQHDFDNVNLYTSKEISSLSDVKDRKIAIHKSFNHIKSEYEKDFNFIVVDDVKEIKKLYQQDEIFGFIISSSALKYLNIPVEKPVYSKDICKQAKLQLLAYVKEDEVLKGLIEKGLDSISKCKMHEIKTKNQLEYIKYNLNLTEEEKEWLRKNKTIEMKVKYKFKPYYYENILHKKTGILNAYIKKIEYILGITFTQNEDKESQIYFGANKLDKESDNLEIMKPYNSYNLSIYSTHEMIIDSINQLEGSKIGVIKKIDKEYLDSKIISGKIQLYDNYDDMVEAMENGEIDYFLCDNLIMQHYIKEKNINEYIFNVGMVNNVFYESIGVNKDNKILIGIMKKLDNSINTDVLPKYNKNNIKSIEDINYALIIKVIIVFFIIIVVSYIYILRLRKSIKVKEELQKDLKQAISNNEELIISLVETLEDVNSLNDSDTGNHIERISKYCEIIVRRISDDEDFIKEVTYFSSLHDIGKVAICDSILKKPGKLTDEEMDIMKTHVSAGYDIIKKNNLSNVANNIILYHHERYDGKGYLRGLKGEEIPIEARIVAIADVYDALRMERCYKPGFSHIKSMDIIVSERGKQFDPKLVDILVDINEEIDKIFNESNLYDNC